MRDGKSIYNRKEKVYEPANQYGGGLLEILYHHPLGRMLLKAVIHPVFSRIYGWYNNSPLSKRQISPFVKKYGINLADYETQNYGSFNEFFVRKIKAGRRPVELCEEVLVSPADSKLSQYPIEKDNRISIKGVSYTLSELVGDRISLKDYAGGSCLVFRLTMDDYHRYIFVDEGRVKRRYHLKGRLHTVSPISKEHKIYRENSRVVNVLQTVNFGEVICIEVGALLVGKIVNHPIKVFEKGMEKGYFKLGGSTIVLLLQKDAAVIDEDIVKHCNEGMEVKVLQGERIGSKKSC
ncbi:MAG: phosphatidylserine decarboxylase [Lachnospiraceae bacterium]|nr:phosphatidylserine decarboxylase [Lachnospiraceae bacterium]